ncbi:hypothetical protein NQ314_012773 [Rhamnusium bicolor]|uniref:Homing endonuclease LAGLIDADG domain-containing protein n=1 Tax=Rhamnusium bicolor TaxID=1586634 RepID=A0AAV8XAK9_9CUCU|nr:hypothetical protein NQ314_012773 [Rhamnusium bicolor]
MDEKTMRVGSTLHWSETLEIMTGSKMATAEPLLEYFGPLYNFLKRENGKYDNYLKFKPKFKKIFVPWNGKGRCYKILNLVMTLHLHVSRNTLQIWLGVGNTMHFLHTLISIHKQSNTSLKMEQSPFSLQYRA